jgi:metal-responsive CopG/Arc/MetJ family transcriptional regulator
VSMPRTIVDIPEAQMRDVDRLCRALGISRAEAVRRALAGFVEQNDSATTDGFGLWKDTASDRAQLIEQLRQRW